MTTFNTIELDDASKKTRFAKVLTLQGREIAFNWIWLSHKQVYHIRIADDLGTIWYGGLTTNEPITVRGVFPNSDEPDLIFLHSFNTADFTPKPSELDDGTVRVSIITGQAVL